MTIDELQIQLDLNLDDKVSILDEYASECPEGYFFIDDEDGHCYLFDEHGNLDDVNKIKTISEDHIKKDIKKITIPDSVASIGEDAFFECSGLTSVMIPNSVKSIEEGAFCDCDRLTSITIPDSTTNIGDEAFEYCSGLTSVSIPDNVTSIGYEAFYNCSGLMNMTIGNGVKSIGDSAFRGCSGLKSLMFKDKTMKQVKAMEHYPWGIKDESIIKTEN